MTRDQRELATRAGDAPAGVWKRSLLLRLSVYAIVVALAILSLAYVVRVPRLGVEAEMARIRDAGEPTTVAETRLGPVPDDQNAALIYQRLFRIRMRGGRLRADSVLDATGYGQLFQDVASGSLPPEAARPALSDPTVEWVYGALEKAATRPHCDFGFGLTPDDNTPQMYEFWEAARWLAARAYLSAGEGDMDDALRWARVGLRMSEHTAERGSSMDLITARIVQAIVTKPLRSAMNQSMPSVAASELTIRCLRSIDRRAQVRRCILVERTNTIYYYAQWRAAGLPLAQSAYYRRTPDLKDRLVRGEIVSRIYASRVRGPFIEAEELRTLIGYRQALEIIDDDTLAVAEKYRRLDHAWTSVPSSSFIGRSHIRACGTMLRLMEQCAAKLDVLEVALALKTYKQSHGRYPQSLEQLQATLDYELPDDVFRDAPLVYRPANEGFLLYSVGANLCDDNGRDTGRRDSGDIVWECAK